MHNESTFSLTEEELDSLKMETSELSPKEENLYKNILEEAKDIFLREYENFMKPALVKKNKENINRILFVSPDSAAEISQAWHNLDVSEDEKHIGGFNTEFGEFSIVENSKLLWERMNPQIKEQLKEILASDDAWLEKYFVHTERIAIGVHELIHTFQDPNLPKFLKECATSYYTSKILESIDITPLTVIPEQEQRAQLYAEFIDKFGEDMHMVFFGSIVNDRSSVRKFIVDAFPKNL